MAQTCKNKIGKSGKKKCCSDVESLLPAKFFKALCDPNRLAIFAYLAGCCAPETVSEVARRFPVDISVVSRHLAMLRDAGILRAEKKGKRVFYFVSYSALVRVLRNMADAIEACCPDNISDKKENRNERKR